MRVEFDADDSRMSSTELFEEIRSGNRQAIEILYRRYLPRLQRVASHRLPPHLKSGLDTGDLVQNALQRALPRLHEFTPEHQGAFLDFLCRIVKNLILDEIRKERRRPMRSEPELGDLKDHRPTPLDEAIGKEGIERYERAMERLAPSDRAAITARVELGFTHAGVARELGLSSADAARVKVRRAIKKLVRAMNQ